MVDISTVYSFHCWSISASVGPLYQWPASPSREKGTGQKGQASSEVAIFCEYDMNDLKIGFLSEAFNEDVKWRKTHDRIYIYIFMDSQDWFCHI